MNTNANADDIFNMRMKNRDEHALNVHFVRDFPTVEELGYTSLPYGNIPEHQKYAPVIVTRARFDENGLKTLVHEIGHAFGLVHTHNSSDRTKSNGEITSKCLQESVRDRYNPCLLDNELTYDTSGDLLCDTNADPNLLGKVGTDCSINRYVGTDLWGDTWLSFGKDNALINYMSYSLEPCVREFTRMQKGVMYFFTKFRFSQSGELLQNHYDFSVYKNIDGFENDNQFYLRSNYKSLPERMQTQNCTFHWQPTVVDGQVVREICDVDYTWFSIDRSRRMVIATRPHYNGGGNLPDTEIKIYRVIGEYYYDPTPIDQDDNSFGGGFSLIDQVLPSGNYVIEIKNKTISESTLSYQLGVFYDRLSFPRGGGGTGTGVTGDGDIDIITDSGSTGGDINGDGNINYVCSGSKLTVSSLPSDGIWSFQWSCSNPNVSIESSTGLIYPTSQTGNVTFKVKVFDNGVQVGELEKTVWLGAPNAPILEITPEIPNNEICPRERITLNSVGANSSVTTYYRWEVFKNGASIYNRNTTSPTLISSPIFVNAPTGVYQAYVSACNDCGCTASIPVNLTVKSRNDPSCGGIRPEKIQTNRTRNEISIYPNPVTNKLTIKLPTSYQKNSTQIELYNSIGQLVLSKSYTDTNIELPVSSYPKGLYILKIQNGEEMKTEKIIIE